MNVPSASAYKYYTFIRPEALKAGWDRDQVMAAIRSEGIPCSTGSCAEIYLEKAFETRAQNGAVKDIKKLR